MIKQNRSTVVYQNPWMTVREDGVTFANDKTGIFGVVEKPDFALIIPFDGNHFTLVNQYRYPVKNSFWEFPQGAWEDKADVDPVELAKGELAEETGLQAGALTEIGYLYEAYGYCNQGFHIFLATDLTKGQQHLESSEADLTTHEYTLQEIKALIEKGEVRDAPTISALGLLLLKNLV